MHTIRNVHERRVAAPVERVAPWIEACWSGGERDCFPCDRIPSWRKNPPGATPLALVPGETLLGHGPFRFRLRAWDGARWRVDVVGGPVGWHGFDLEPDGDGCRVTHTLELESSTTGRARWTAIEPVHDWAVEALFDRLEHALRTGVVPARTDRPMSPVAALAFGVARRVSPRRGATGDGSGPPVEPLPYIDEYVARIDAPAERVWTALLTTMRKLFPRAVRRERGQPRSHAGAGRSWRAS